MIDPDTHVNDFLAELRLALASMGASLDEDPSLGDGKLRSFQIPEAKVETRLLVLPTPQSPNLPFGEYRAIVTITFPSGTERALERLAFDGSPFATLGTMIRDGRQMSAQTIIEPGSPGTLAGILAASMMHAGPSMLEYLRRTQKPSKWNMLRQQPDTREQEAPISLSQPSAWSALELEQMHFSLAYAGHASLEGRTWQLKLGAMTLSLTAMDDHPYFGGGLLSRLSILRDICSVDGVPVRVVDLNSADIFMGDAPTFGSWIADAEGYSFMSFLPNSLEALPEFAEHWLDWSMRRAEGVRSLAEFCHTTLSKL